MSPLFEAAWQSINAPELPERLSGEEKGVVDSFIQKEQVHQEEQRKQLEKDLPKFLAATHPERVIWF